MPAKPFAFVALFLLASVALADDVAFYLSSPKAGEDGKRRSLEAQKSVPWEDAQESNDFRIDVDPTQTFQTILGMGTSLEPTTCFNIHQLGDEDQKEVIRKLVDPEAGIGMNLIRVCVGTPDFTGDPWYSYNDLPQGQTDPKLEKFSIERTKPTSCR